MNQSKKYLFPFILVTSLFFFWGLIHNLDPVLIAHLRKTFQLTTLQSSLAVSRKVSPLAITNNAPRNKAY